MKPIAIALALSLTGAVLLGIGCDTPPSAPPTRGPLQITGEGPTARAEREAAQQLVNAYAIYEHDLIVLREFYNLHGFYYKRQWAENELNNLRASKTFEYEMVEPTVPLESGNIATADEAVLVEAVLADRADYLRAADYLVGAYTQMGDQDRAELADSIRRRFDPIRTYKYFLDAEVPPATLRPAEVIPAAETLYLDAKRLYDQGRVVPLVIDYQKEREALNKLLELVHTYPTSTRIAYAAYYIAEIYKEYFDEDYRAVLWYERAWQWDPNITKPARFQAAVVSDYRLHNRGRALELYQAVLEHEQFNQSNVRFSQRRIEELLEQN